MALSAFLAVAVVSLASGCDGTANEAPADLPTGNSGINPVGGAQPQGSPAFSEWPEVPAPPVGQMMNHSAGGFRQEAYYRGQPAGDDVYRELVNFYVDALSRIGEVQRPPEGQREGETTLRVETADGRSATVVVHTRGPDDTVDVRLELTHPYE